MAATSDVRSKDPLKVKAGRASARAQWGEYPRTVRLDDLTQPQRALVFALIEAERQKNAPANSSTAEASRSEVRDANVSPTD